DDVLSFLDADRLQAPKWWIDVALEYHIPGRVIQWTRTGHATLLQALLPSLDEGNLGDLVDNERKFHLDYNGQVRDFAGFRCEPGAQGRTDNIKYINCYTTDKAITYQLHKGGIWDWLHAKQLFPKEIEKLLSTLDARIEVLSTCAGSEGRHAHETTARIEIRVPLTTAHHRLRSLPDNVLQLCLTSIPAKHWWSYKLYRTVGLRGVIESLAASPKESRTWPESLTLGAAAIYMLNALVYRPRSGVAENALVQSVSARL
ncbi:hypothetical protein K474DRAFT_1557004, partial [Panus rudis PR-1116 ss-1]